MNHSLHKNIKQFKIKTKSAYHETLKTEVMMLKIQNKLSPSTSVVGYMVFIIVDYQVKIQAKAIGLLTDLSGVGIFCH